MKSKKHRKYNEAFSLMETLIWVGIVSIFSGMIVISGVGLMNRTKAKAAKSDMNTISIMLLEYSQDNAGKFPAEDEGLMVLVEGGYIESKGEGKDFLDPWKTPYQYSVENEGLGYRLVSLGADRKEGGKGVNEDIIEERGTDEGL
ncbi:MAG: type II secretion system protein GspG [Spirochaetes bacterium]|nr:type II secretion system protein GspG [Spirochaetota bacterium]